MRGDVSIAVLACILLSGCAGPAADLSARTLATSDVPAPIVIALLDSGINPYLPIYEIGEEVPIAGAVTAPYETVALTRNGTIEERAERDLEIGVWERQELGRLYHFEGTRAFGISFDEHNPWDEPNLDGVQHGTATSYLAAREAPEAIIVMVQVGARYCLQREETSCFLEPSIATGMEWIAAQDWIDVVSISLGMPANAPNHPGAMPEMDRYIAASRAAAASGKIIINGAGNDPTPVMADYLDGPPWIVTVGGFEYNASGEHVVTSRLVDVVANFSEYVPRFLRAEMQWRGGTSLATPIVAGTLAHALHLIREAEPGRAVTTQELRDALNASATYVNATDWDPRPPGRDPLPWDITGYASLPILVQPQMGWGYVDASLAPEIARRVLEGDLAPPPGKDQAIVFQPAWQRAREEFWATYPG